MIRFSSSSRGLRFLGGDHQKDPRREGNGRDPHVKLGRA